MGLGSSEARRAFLDGRWRVRVDVEPLRRQIRDHGEDEQADRGGAVDGDATCVRTHAGPVAFGAASWAPHQARRDEEQRNGCEKERDRGIRDRMDQIHPRLLPRRAGGETVQPVEFHFRENPPFDFVELDVLDEPNRNDASEPSSRSQRSQRTPLRDRRAAARPCSTLRRIAPPCEEARGRRGDPEPH